MYSFVPPSHKILHGNATGAAHSLKKSQTSAAGRSSSFRWKEIILSCARAIIRDRRLSSIVILSLWILYPNGQDYNGRIEPLGNIHPTRRVYVLGKTLHLRVENTRVSYTLCMKHMHCRQVSHLRRPLCKEILCLSAIIRPIAVIWWKFTASWLCNNSQHNYMLYNRGLLSSRAYQINHCLAKQKPACTHAWK